VKRATYKFIVYYSYLNGWKGFENEAEMYQSFVDDQADTHQLTVFKATACGSVVACKLVPYWRLNPLEVRDES